MKKVCSRWGVKVSQDTKICNGCGNRCDFTSTNKEGKRMIFSILASLPIILLIVVAIVLNSLD